MHDIILSKGISVLRRERRSSSQSKLAGNDAKHFLRRSEDPPHKGQTEKLKPQALCVEEMESGGSPER